LAESSRVLMISILLIWLPLPSDCHIYMSATYALLYVHLMYIELTVDLWSSTRLPHSLNILYCSMIDCSTTSWHKALLHLSKQPPFYGCRLTTVDALYHINKPYSFLRKLVPSPVKRVLLTHYACMNVHNHLRTSTLSTHQLPFTQPLLLLYVQVFLLLTFKADDEVFAVEFKIRMQLGYLRRVLADILFLFSNLMIFFHNKKRSFPYHSEAWRKKGLFSTRSSWFSGFLFVVVFSGADDVLKQEALYLLVWSWRQWFKCASMDSVIWLWVFMCWE